MNDTVALVLTVVLLALNGFFVATEFALVAARRSVVEPRAEGGHRGARSALGAMERISLMLAGAQLGITICSLALGAVSEPAIAHLIEPVLHACRVPASWGHPIAFAVALALVTVLHVVVGEMIPKNVTLAAPERAAAWLAPPFVAVVTAFRPLIALLDAVTNLLLRAVGVTPRAEVSSAFTREEVAQLVAESHREGHLDADEHRLLQGAVEFPERTAADVLLPRAELVLAPDGVTPDALETLAARTGRSRFPLPDLSGYLHVKDALPLPARGAAMPASLTRPLPAVAPDAPLTRVLETMRARRTHLVRVGDDGIVALRDVLAALVG